MLHQWFVSIIVIDKIVDVIVVGGIDEVIVDGILKRRILLIFTLLHKTPIDILVIDKTPIHILITDNILVDGVVAVSHEVVIDNIDLVVVVAIDFLLRTVGIRFETQILHRVVLLQGRAAADRSQAFDLQRLGCLDEPAQLFLHDVHLQNKI